MKEKIYTIPVNEAFDSETECPFCALRRKAEADTMNYVMGASYMEEDVREQTDKAGFCKEHYRQMLSAGNKLGVALMLQTRIKKLIRDCDDTYKAELEATVEKRGLFSKNTDVSAYCKYAKSVKDSCFACDMIDAGMDRYFDTFFHLWNNEEEFRNKVLGGKGFCIEHFARITEDGKKKLGFAAYARLKEKLIPIQQSNFKRLDEELEHFIRKFDYRFKDEPWGNAKDSVERGILKISGYDGGIL